MALNQEEGFLTRMGFGNMCFGEGCLNDKVDEFGDFGGLNCEKGEFYDRKGGKDNKSYDDEIADLLPHDPFGMGTGLTAITGWLEGFDKDFGLKSHGFKTDEFGVLKVEDPFFAELNFVMTGTMSMHQDTDLQKIDGNCELFGMDFGEGMDGNMEEIIGFSYDKYLILSDTTGNAKGGTSGNCDIDGSDPSDALFLALGYLGLGELLVVERVCKSLRDAVRGDPLLWRSIHIDHPFSTMITDDNLIKLTNRAQGHLHSLSLVCCSRITDAGLKHVLERNPSLTKLSVPGCVRLTIDGILSNLKVFKSAGKPKLKYLGIYGVFGLTNQHFEEFKLLLGVDNSNLPTICKPRFFGGGQLCANSDDDRAMDVEVCPKCQQLGLVYDCPSEICQKKQQLCRACTICITRCISCGCCLNNCEYEELFSFDLLCLDCWRQLLGCQEGDSPKTTILHKQASYRFYVCG